MRNHSYWKRNTLNSVLQIDEDGTCTIKHRLLYIVFISLVMKCLLALYFPLLGDEAYFALCGRHIAQGYYDHPPMTGWLLHLFQYLGQSPFVLRLPPILFSTTVGLGIYFVLRPHDSYKAYLIFLLFIFSPANSLFFIATADTPLLLFSALSAFSLYKAEKDNSNLYYLLSGIFWGLAFLSKYFVILLGLSYFLYFFLTPRACRTFKKWGLLILGAAPFVAQNAFWNYQKGWPNIMHNLFNRLVPDSSPLVNLFCLGISIVYITTPPVLYFLFKNRKGMAQKLQSDNSRLFAFASIVPLCVFILASFEKRVHPHWYLSFLPFTYFIVAIALDKNEIVKTVKFAFILSLAQFFFCFSASFFPTEKLKGYVAEADLASLVTYTQPQKVLLSLEKYRGRFVFATTSYSTSAVLEYYHGDRVIVFGKGSNHARQDDIRTGFKELDGSDILILHRTQPDDSGYQSCFERTEILPVKVNSASLYLLLGHNFNYQRYRDKYLFAALQAYYQIPEWLPGSRSFFHEKYDFQHTQPLRIKGTLK